MQQTYTLGAPERYPPGSKAWYRRRVKARISLRSLWLFFIGPATACLALLGCQHPIAVEQTPLAPAAPEPHVVTSVPTAPHSEAAPTRPPHDHHRHGGTGLELALFDDAAMRELELNGFDFAAFGLQLPSSARGAGGTPAHNQELAEDPGYRSIVETLSTDLREIRQQDSRAGVGLNFSHRLFDATWLTSEKFRFELVGVVNRVDRRVFAPGTCGELRLIYRLAYKGEVSGKPVRSRVPMTINAVRYVKHADCKAWLESWSLSAREGKAASAALTTGSGPLSPNALSKTTPKAIEVNLQSVRWPSTVRPNMAGHAEYLLRVFGRAQPAGPFLPSPMENTPDVERLSKDKKLREALAQWITTREATQQIDAGTVQVPVEFLAKKAVSVAPRGLARYANRPFSQLLDAELGASGGFEVGAFQSPAALLRRLDGLSCQGCHQSRSVAGFHVLGRDPAGQRVDALAMPHSAHFTDDMRRRSQYVAQLVSGETPNERRPPAERPAGEGQWGSHCGLKQGPGAPFASWTCGSGLTCRAVDDPEVGQCMPETPEIGDACELGVTSQGTAARDTTRLFPTSSCGPNRVCERNAVGFPGGMCAAGCSSRAPEATCGGIAVLSTFNACLARAEPFDICITENTRPAALRKCSHEAPCRADYVCAASGDKGGTCLPPYFLFQLRVDGHVY